jgi:hypothetical protein
MKYKYAALAQQLSDKLEDKYEVEAYFNEIRVVIEEDDDKDEKSQELSNLLEEINSENMSGYRLKVMYPDEYPGGFSPERAIIQYLSEKFPNTLILSREKNIVVITMNIPEVDENTDYVGSLIKEKYHIYRQICSDVPHRGRPVSISLRLGISSFNFIINETASINAYGCKNLSNFAASIIFYLVNLPKNQFHTLESAKFTTSNDAFITTLIELVNLGYIEVKNLQSPKRKFEVKLLNKLA